MNKKIIIEIGIVLTLVMLALPIVQSCGDSNQGYYGDTCETYFTITVSADDITYSGNRVYVEDYERYGPDTVYCFDNVSARNLMILQNTDGWCDTITITYGVEADVYYIIDVTVEEPGFWLSIFIAGVIGCLLGFVIGIAVSD